jgi:hypothetical protein
VALGCRRPPRRIARFSQRFVHYSILGFGARTGRGQAGRYFSLSDWRSLCATYSAALLSPCHLRRNSITSQPWSLRGMAMPRCKRKYRRGPRRKVSAAPASTIWSASSESTWAIREPSYRRTGIPSGFARLVGGAVSYSGRAAGGTFIRHPQSASRPRPLLAGSQPWR